MAILDTSSANTYLADTMTNSKPAADLVTGPINPVSYTDQLMANISVDQVANLDPNQAALDLVGFDGSTAIPPGIYENFVGLDGQPISVKIPDRGVKGVPQGPYVARIYWDADLHGWVSAPRFGTIQKDSSGLRYGSPDPNNPVPIDWSLITGGTLAQNAVVSTLQNALNNPPSIGDVMKYVDLSSQLSAIMEIVNSMTSIISLITNGMQTLTDGNIPDTIRSEVVGRILSVSGQNGGAAPSWLYASIAAILYPYVSGQTESALSLALEANRLFGMIDDPISLVPGDIKISIFKDEYDAKMTLLTSGFAELTSGGGLLKTVDLDPVVASDSPKVTSEGTIITSANPPVVQIPPPPPDKQFEGVDGNWEFESGDTNQYMTAGGRFVSSVEELECEMSAITRPISEVILHWSETFTNANLTGLELQQLTGAGSNAYHYIIKRDGSMERGVPLDEVGTASPGHNTYSIQICLVGGVNVASEDDAINGNLGASSITRTQFNTLHQLFRVFFLHFPGGQALGHGEFDVTQLDPGFEVRDYVYNAFNKRSLYIDPLNEPEITPEEIITSIDNPGLLITEKNTQSSGLEKF